MTHKQYNMSGYNWYDLKDHKPQHGCFCILRLIIKHSDECVHEEYRVGYYFKVSEISDKEKEYIGGRHFFNFPTSPEYIFADVISNGGTYIIAFDKDITISDKKSYYEWMPLNPRGRMELIK